MILKCLDKLITQMIEYNAKNVMLFVETVNITEEEWRWEIFQFSKVLHSVRLPFD